MRFAFAKKEERERTRTIVEREETPTRFVFVINPVFVKNTREIPFWSVFGFISRLFPHGATFCCFFSHCRGVRFCSAGPMPMIAAQRQRRARPWATGGSDRRVEAGAGAGRSA